jgi:antitoxin YefM
MRVTTVADLRKNFKQRMDEVHADHDILIINRQGDKDMVMLSLEDYNALKETAYLLSTKKNARRLFESMEQLEKGKTIKKNLDEL